MEQKTLSETLDELLEFIDSIPMCIKLFDPKGNLLFLNKEGRDEHFIKDTDDITKWDWLGTVKLEYQEKAKEYFKKALNGETVTIDFEHTKEGSKHEWCSSLIFPIKDKSNNITSILFYSSDISKTKKLENVLKERIDELEHTNKLIVERELEMVDQKSEIERLKKEIEELNLKISKK